jgi:hypothetical protein
LYHDRAQSAAQPNLTLWEPTPVRKAVAKTRRQQQQKQQQKQQQQQRRGKKDI